MSTAMFGHVCQYATYHV